MLHLHQHAEDDSNANSPLWQTLLRLSHVVELYQPRYASLFSNTVERALQDRKQSMEQQPPMTIILHADSEEQRIQLALDWNAITPDLVDDFLIEEVNLSNLPYMPQLNIK